MGALEGCNTSVTICSNHPSAEPEPAWDQKLQSLPPQFLNNVITVDTMCPTISCQRPTHLVQNKKQKNKAIPPGVVKVAFVMGIRSLTGLMHKLKLSLGDQRSASTPQTGLLHRIDLMLVEGAVSIDFLLYSLLKQKQNKIYFC